MVLNIRKASVHLWIVMGDLFEAACCSSILPACTIIEKGFSPEVGNKLFHSTNSLFQIFSLSFEETDAPRGTQSDKWICELLGHAKLLLWDKLPAGSHVNTLSNKVPSAVAGIVAAAGVDSPNTGAVSSTEFTIIG